MAKQKDLSVSMAELKTDLKYIKKALDANDEQHKNMLEIIQKYIEETDKRFELKADKSELNTIRNWFLSSLIFVITLLLSVIGYLLSRILFKG